MWIRNSVLSGYVRVFDGAGCRFDLEIVIALCGMFVEEVGYVTWGWVLGRFCDSSRSEAKLGTECSFGFWKDSVVDSRAQFVRRIETRPFTDNCEKRGEGRKRSRYWQPAFLYHASAWRIGSSRERAPNVTLHHQLDRRRDRIVPPGPTPRRPQRTLQEDRQVAWSVATWVEVETEEKFVAVYDLSGVWQ